ncbi:MAG: aldehyde dehydrogenase family protein [Pseudonocardiales bacterium]|nr:aldehyde dehydrogenase family protein [Pseudonocardiales bacterium]
MDVGVPFTQGLPGAGSHERAGHLRRLALGLQVRTEEIARTITTEMGAPLAFSLRVQVGLPVTVMSSYAEVAASFNFEEKIDNSLVILDPIGVVAAITPWNFPLHQVVLKVAAALAAGCTVIVKPSELAPLSTDLLAELAHEIGLPAGVLNIVHGTGPRVGDALARHPGIDMVSFTGSPRAGREVARRAGETLKKVTLASRRAAVGIAAEQRRELPGAVAVLQPALERGKVSVKSRADEQVV